MKLLLSIILLFLLSSPILAADGVSIVWLGSGWLIKHTYTNPAPVPGTALTINAVVSYEVDGIPQTATTTATLTGSVPATTTKQIYTSTLPLKAIYNIAEKSGDGDASFDASGKLVFNVSAVNDGKPHTMQFKLMLIAP